MLLVAGALAATTALGGVSPALLLALTGALALGAGLNAPAWQATIPELVAREELSAAVALNGTAVNLSRAVGPALGGLVIGLSDPSAAFALNALSFTGVIVALARWQRPRAPSPLPAERLLQAMRTGLQYTRHAEGFRGVLVRAAAFLFPASALWALLPLVARERLALGPLGYGALVGAIGVGAVVGTWLLPKLRGLLSSDRLTLTATLIVAAGLALLPLVSALVPALALLSAVGVAWLVMLASLHVAAQSGAAPWVRGRALSVFRVAFFASYALGSVVWGAPAEGFGLDGALRAAAAVLALGALLVRRFALDSTEALDLAPSLHWPTPHAGAVVDDPRVLIAVEYIVDEGREPAFLDLVVRLRRSRMRDGAYGWGLFRAPDRPECFVETFYAASWTEHLRQHARVTRDDATLQREIRGLLREGAPPKVSHLLEVRPGASRAP
jgi:predicted MFS family arabinose efflux permease